ncbi:MAG: hypothetical protein ACRC92_20135 [Peptostreptococcaceae bacterium]
MKIELIELVNENRVSVVHSDSDRTLYIMCETVSDYELINNNINDLYLLGEHMLIDKDKYSSSIFPQIDSMLNSSKFLILLFLDKSFGGI